MNLVSVATAYGLLTDVFQRGWGAGLIGPRLPVPIVSYVPMVMFAILFGLSLDHEVFLLPDAGTPPGGRHQSREHHRRAGSAGRIITAGALIMVSVSRASCLSETRRSRCSASAWPPRSPSPQPSSAACSSRRDDPHGPRELVAARLARPSPADRRDRAARETKATELLAEQRDFQPAAGFDGQ